MTVDNKRPIFTTGEVARLLGISRDTIRKAEQSGRIPLARREDRSKDRVFYPEDIAALRTYFRR